MAEINQTEQMAINADEQQLSNTKMPQIQTEQVNNSRSDALSNKTGKQLRQLIISDSNDALIEDKHDKHDKDKALKAKLKKRRELDGIRDNTILSSRLRSSSGKVYSSSVSVEQGSAPNSPVRSLASVAEGESASDLEAFNATDNESIPESLLDMCPKEECCKGTATLIGMISGLKASVDGVLKKFSTQEIVTSNTSHRVQDLQDKFEKQEEEIDDLGKELHETKFQLKMVSNIVIKQDQQIAILQQKISDMQKREMAANIVVSGIPESNNENPIAAFNKFVQEGLEIQELIPANKAFRIGSGKNRPLLVELRHGENKRKLFSHAMKLKGKKNDKGQSYFLADHLPENMNEDRRRANELFAENKKKQTSHRLDMNFNKGQLFISQEPYVKAIRVPNARDMLDPDDLLFERAKELDFVKGDVHNESKSKFVSFAVAVQDFEDIRAAFLELKMKFADASHVACAYRLPGCNTPKNQDFVDDGEYGCGRSMLQALKEEQLLNVAIFIVRYFGGTHLGVRRFEIFRELSKTAIKELMIQRTQDDEEPVQQIPENLKQPPFPPAPPQTEDWSTEATEDWSKVTKKKD